MASNFSVLFIGSVWLVDDDNGSKKVQCFCINYMAVK
jgi:hypothetical protein